MIEIIQLIRNIFKVLPSLLSLSLLQFCTLGKVATGRVKLVFTRDGFLHWPSQKVERGNWRKSTDRVSETVKLSLVPWPPLF